MAAALAMLVLGSVLTLSAQASALRRTNVETSLALSAALNTVEQLRTTPFSTLASLNGSGFAVQGLNGQPGGLAAVEGDPDGLPGELAVVIDQQSGSTILYRVTATVRWQGVSGNRSLSMSALIGERK